MIVDTHVHYSEPHRPDRPYDPAFMTSDNAAHGSKPHTVDEILSITGAAGVDKIVQVVQTKMGYDNTYGLEGAALHPDRIVGIVGRFDPLAPGVAERLKKFAAQRFILGVRFTLITPQTISQLRDDSLNEFLAAADQQDVAVQIYAPYQVPEMLQAARRYRGVRFLIDHMALNHRPLRPLEEVLGNWNELIGLAQEPNVWIKVSFFPEAAQVTEGFPYPKAQERFKELYDYRAGPSRLIWGSNYPPVGDVCTYQQSLDFVREHCAFLAPADRAAILGGNFMRDFAERVKK